jgi:hypothetical protein
MQPASPESPFFRAEGPHRPFKEGVEFAVGLTLEYDHGLLHEVGYDVIGEKTRLATLVKDAILARIGASITPVHWLSLDLGIPFALFERGDKPVNYSITPHTVAPAGVGDLRAGVHFRPIDAQKLGLIVGGYFWAPFGSQPAYLSDARPRAEVDIGVAGEAGPIIYGCTVNIAPGLFGRRNGDRAALACAGHYMVTPAISIGLEPSFALINYTNTKDQDSFSTIIEPLAAARIRAGGFRFGVGLGPGFGGAAGAAQVRAMLNFAYVGLGKPPKPPPPPPSDRDIDKIIDKEDACPDEAGAPNQDPKLNGCPQHDRDADGIDDAADFCPDRTGIAHPNPKANGCPDSDNDTLPDPIDSCINEPGPSPSGCPKYARLTNSGFQINPPIEFGRDEKLTADGRAALEEIAATMRANPKIEQVSLGIGTKGANNKLSDKRAQEVLLVFRAGNLDSSRYEVVLRDDLRGGNVVVRLIR